MSVYPGPDEGGYTQPPQPVVPQQANPQFVQQTNVTVVQQPTAAPVSNPLLIGSVSGHRDWSTGLMGCFDDCSIACRVMHCYACVVCDIANRTGECCCLPFFMPDALIPMRTRIRTLGGIRGSIFGDCCALTLCHECAVCQMARELDAMGL